MRYSCASASACTITHGSVELTNPKRYVAFSLRTGTRAEKKKKEKRERGKKDRKKSPLHVNSPKLTHKVDSKMVSPEPLHNAGSCGVLNEGSNWTAHTQDGADGLISTSHPISVSKR